MDFLTALSTISKSGLALLATMESSTDPSRVAVFETYRGVITLNARMGQAEKVLLAVHKDIEEIPELLREALLNQEAQTAVRTLRAVAEGQLNAYERYVDNIGSDELSLDEAYQLYSEDLKRRFDRLEDAIIRTIDTSPLALDEVLSAIAMEIYFLRREGNSYEAIRSTIDARFERLNEVVENRLNPMVERANAQMLGARAVVESNTSVSDWNSGGSVVYFPGTYFATWPNYTLYVSCVRLMQTELIKERDLFLTTMMIDSPLYEVIVNPQLDNRTVGQKPFNTCGTSGMASTVKQFGSNSTYVDFRNLIIDDQKVDYIDTHPSGGTANFNDAHAGRAQRLTTLKTDLQRVNLATTRFAILVEYRENLRKAMAETREHLDQYARLETSEELDQSFLEEIEHLGTALGENSLDVRIFAIERQEAQLEGDAIRRQLIEAAMAADRQIAAGQARFEAELEASKASDNLLLKNFLKQLGLGVKLLKATETAYKQVQLLEKQLSDSSSDGRYDIPAARQALEKLEQLGIPSGPPSSLDLTEQEIAAQAFMDAAFAGSLEVLAEDVSGANRPTGVTKFVLREAIDAPEEIVEMRGIAERYLLAIIEARMK